MPSTTLRALLTELIDYAGLFPPAALTMTDVRNNYDAYRRSPDAWALGRVVVPVDRLAEFSDAAGTHGSPPWRVSALAGDDVLRDAATIREVLATGRMTIDTVESRASSVAAITSAAKALSQSHTLYLEVPVIDDPGPLIAAIGSVGARAKIRTGGVTRGAFPTAAQVARFVARCAEHGVAFKATAGLHHPLCGDYPLTYEDGAPCGAMFGFLNVFLAAAFGREGMTEPMLAELLAERVPAALRFTDDAIHWRRHALPRSQVTSTRAAFAVAFGSCSFREPIDDLRRLGLL